MIMQNKQNLKDKQLNLSAAEIGGQDGIRYSSFIRFGTKFITDPAIFDHLVEYLKKYSGVAKEVTFFDNFFHSVPDLRLIREFADAFSKRLPVLRSLGIRVGINHLCTTGFFEQGDELIFRGAPFSVDREGTVRVGNLCPSNEKSLKYVDECYSILAKTKPDIIYVDDDIKFHYHAICYCDECLKNFEKEYGVFAKHNLAPSRENLNTLFQDPSVQEDWLSFNTKTIAALYSRIEKTVHTFSPETEIGIMTCVSPFMKSEIASYCESAKGEKDHIRLRPGGGVYDDRNIYKVIEKTGNIQSQIVSLPDFVTKIEAEIENFPCQPFRKSRRFFSFECLNYLAGGCTGIAYSVFDPAYPFTEYEDKWKMIRALDAFGDRFTRLFQRSKLFGVNILSGFTDRDDVPRKIGYFNESVEQLSCLGIPLTPDTDCADVFVLTANMAKRLDEQTLRRAFSRSVFMDGEALAILNERGFSEYTGFTVTNVYEKDCIERDLPSSFNLDGGKRRQRRDGCQAFWWMPEYSKAYAIEATCPNAEYLTELIDFDENKKGYGMAVGYNSFGNKVCVSGYYPYSFGFCPARQHQLRSAFLWLSEGCVKAVVRSSGPLQLVQRQLDESRYGVILSNFSLDAAENIRLEVLGSPEDLTFVCYNEENVIEEKMAVLSSSENKTLVSVPRLPPLCVGYALFNLSKRA